MDDAQDEKRGVSWSACIVVLFSVLVLYVLSAGPVAYILERNDDFETWEWLCGTAYRPIVLVVDAGYGSYLAEYVEWWADLASDQIAPAIPVAPPSPTTLGPTA